MWGTSPVAGSTEVQAALPDNPAVSGLPGEQAGSGTQLLLLGGLLVFTVLAGEEVIDELRKG